MPVGITVFKRGEEEEEMQRELKCLLLYHDYSYVIGYFIVTVRIRFLFCHEGKDELLLRWDHWLNIDPMHFTPASFFPFLSFYVSPAAPLKFML